MLVSLQQATPSNRWRFGRRQASTPPTLRHQGHRVKNDGRFHQRPLVPIQTSAGASFSRTVEAPTQPEAKLEPHNDAFSWSKQWYPIDIIADLDPAKPHAVKLLNQDLVLWRDVDGGWRAFEDRCPHRLAPLSQGRIEPSNGALECAYHGWQFDKAGKAIRIPQLADPAAAATACGSSRSCVRSYPVQERYGLLWVWGEAGPQAAAEAALQPVPRNNVPELEPTSAADGNGTGWRQQLGWTRRDVPVAYDLQLENLLDYCHVFFAHHGVQGISRSMERGTSMSPVNEISAAGFAVEVAPKQRDEDGRPPLVLEYKAPSNVIYQMAPTAYLVIITTPMATGRSRVFVTQLARTQPKQAAAKGFRMPLPAQLAGALLSRFPVLEHTMVRAPILDGDTYILHQITYKMLQEQETGRNGSSNGSSSNGASSNAANSNGASSKSPATSNGSNGSGTVSGARHHGGGAHAAATATGADVNSVNWRRAYYLPGSSDTTVVRWRQFLDRYGASLPVLPKSLADMPPPLTHYEATERWHTHTASCRHCSRAAGLLQLVAGAVQAAAALFLLLAAADLGRGLPLASTSVVLKLSGMTACALLAPRLRQLREWLFVYAPWIHSEKH